MFSHWLVCCLDKLKLWHANLPLGVSILITHVDKDLNCKSNEFLKKIFIVIVRKHFGKSFFKTKFRYRKSSFQCKRKKAFDKN